MRKRSFEQYIKMYSRRHARQLNTSVKIEKKLKKDREANK